MNRAKLKNALGYALPIALIVVSVFYYLVEKNKKKFPYRDIISGERGTFNASDLTHFPLLKIAGNSATNFLKIDTVVRRSNTDASDTARIRLGNLHPTDTILVIVNYKYSFYDRRPWDGSFPLPPKSWIIAWSTDRDFWDISSTRIKANWLKEYK